MISELAQDPRISGSNSDADMASIKIGREEGPDHSADKTPRVRL